MATANSTAATFALDVPSEQQRTLAIAPGASRSDVANLLESKIHHLTAMLAMTYGAAGESFRSLPDDTQDGYLWAACSLAKEVKALYLALEADRFEGWSTEEQQAT